jgi:3-keto-5-aminohexanoate cleavage enzyme
MAKTWLEVALSGPWTRKNQPRIPITVAEIVADGIAAAHEGAAIVHVHPYDEATGRQKDDADIYARIIEGIRSKVDVIVYPTLPSDPVPGSELSGVGAHRHAPVEELARRGLIEWSLVDPGSVNLSGYDEIAKDVVGSVYLNVESDARAGFAIARHYGLRPSCAVFEPGFIRLGAALSARFPGLKTPLYRFMFSEGYTFGFLPKLYGLEAYLATLMDSAPHAPWMVGGLRCDITPLIEATVKRGGHVRVGLEDMAYGCDQSNAQLVAAGAKAILGASGTLASAQDIRAALADADRVASATP